VTARLNAALLTFESEVERNQVSTLYKLLVISITSVACACAGSITFNGPFGATDSGVYGPHQYFDIQSATLTQPTTVGGDWTVTIDTNYGTTLPGSGGTVVPDFTFDGVNLAAADFLISWNGASYGVVLNAHDGYTSGDFYQINLPNAFQTAQQAINNPSVPTSQYGASDPVWLNAGGTLAGSGTVSAAAFGNGTTNASYTITDTFAAPANFLSTGDFTIDMSSADCANGFMTGTGNFGGGGTGGGQIPEPGTLLLTVPVLLAGYYRARRVIRRC
jgi:hypothetical protein